MLLLFVYNKLMKTKLIICLLSVSISYPTFCQWNKVNSLDSFEPIEESGIIRFSDSTGYSLESYNSKPKLFVSHDEGQSWKIKRFFNEVIGGANQIHDFIIKQNGNLLICNPDHVLEMDSAFLFIDTVFKIAPKRTDTPDDYFKSPELIGFGKDSILMLSHNLFISYDDGKTWKRKSDFFAHLHQHFHFVDDKNGFFIGRSIDFNNLKVFTTKDGGTTWDSVGEPLQGKTASIIKFISQKVGFLGGRDNCLYKTTDGGETWQQWFCLNDGKPEGSIRSITFLTDMIGWITIANRNEPYKTVDGGKTFFNQILPSPKPISVSSVELISPNLMFLTGSQLYRSTNEGGSPLLSVKQTTENYSTATRTLYPNPANSQLHINTETDTPLQLVIFDVVGKKHISINNYNSNAAITIAQLSQGVYFVHLSSGNTALQTLKFIKR